MAQAFSEAFSVGHRPSESLTPQDETLFRSFQTNLLSLISHELRTPLMGILNALSLLEQGGEEASSEFSLGELISMARRNAQRLQGTLASLLDLAALESGVFQARLREIDLSRLVEARIEAHRSLFRDGQVKAQVERGKLQPLLADPQKLGRAVDLCFQVLLPRVVKGTQVKIRISSSGIAIEFQLAEDQVKAWDAAWSQSVAGFESGILAPGSAFAGILQSEQAFLSRMEEGLGSELLLVHEIMRLHHGKLSVKRTGPRVSLDLEFPELSSSEGLRAVLASRIFEASHELGTVALALLHVPPGKSGQGAEEFRQLVKSKLFRASDAVYALPERQQVALVMDDCRPEDAPRLLARLEKGLGIKLQFGIANCPSESSDPVRLLGLAEERLLGAAKTRR